MLEYCFLEVASDMESDTVTDTGMDTGSDMESDMESGMEVELVGDQVEGMQLFRYGIDEPNDWPVLLPKLLFRTGLLPRAFPSMVDASTRYSSRTNHIPCHKIYQDSKFSRI